MMCAKQPSLCAANQISTQAQVRVDFDGRVSGFFSFATILKIYLIFQQIMRLV